MTITIPAGTTLYREDGVPMYVADDSKADVVAEDFCAYEVKFEDGEEYLVLRADLIPKTQAAAVRMMLELGIDPHEVAQMIHTNPGNNVTHVNGADVTEHGARRRIS